MTTRRFLDALRTLHENYQEYDGMAITPFYAQAATTYGTGGIGIIGDAIHVAVVLGVPLDHIAIHDIIEVRIILVGQLVQRIDITLLIQ